MELCSASTGQARDQKLISGGVPHCICVPVECKDPGMVFVIMKYPGTIQKIILKDFII